MFNLRVYYEDTDAGGVVYYANYLKYLERARTQILLNNNLNHSLLKDKYNIFFIVKSCDINYIKPAKLDNNLNIITTVNKKSRIQIYLNQKIFFDKNLITEAFVRLVTVNNMNKVIKMPINLYKIF